MNPLEAYLNALMAFCDAWVKLRADSAPRDSRRIVLPDGSALDPGLAAAALQQEKIVQLQQAGQRLAHALVQMIDSRISEHVEAARRAEAEALTTDTAQLTAPGQRKLD